MCIHSPLHPEVQGYDRFRCIAKNLLKTAQLQSTLDSCETIAATGRHLHSFCGIGIVCTYRVSMAGMEVQLPSTCRHRQPPALDLSDMRTALAPFNVLTCFGRGV